jgi:hypothetical protein
VASEKPKMETHPPKILEVIVGRLIPPACREYVLGDLCERYTSPRQYVMDAVRTVPRVIMSRIRRTAVPQILLAEVGVSYLSFLGAALMLVGPPFLDGWPAGLRLSLPVLTAVAVLVTRDAYAHAETRSPHDVVLDVIIVVVGTGLSQTILAAVMPWLALPRGVIIQGSLVSAFALALVRVGRWRPDAGIIIAAGPRSLATIREEAVKFEDRIRRRNLAEYLAAVVVFGAFGSRLLWVGSQPLIRLGAALTLVATLYVVHHLHTRGAAQTIPLDAEAARAVYRRSLERQRDLQKSIWRCICCPSCRDFSP